MERTGKAFLREVELLCWWRSWPGTTSWWLLVSLFPPSAQVRAKMKSNRTHMNPGRRSPQLPCCRTVIFTQFDKWTVMFSSAQHDDEDKTKTQPDASRRSAHFYARTARKNNAWGDTVALVCCAVGIKVSNWCVPPMWTRVTRSQRDRQLAQCAPGNFVTVWFKVTSAGEEDLSEHKRPPCVKNALKIYF